MYDRIYDHKLQEIITWVLYYDIKKTDSSLSVCFCSGGGTRTPDKVVNSHLLYQLSYSGIIITIKNAANLYYFNIPSNRYISFSAINILSLSNKPCSI